MNGREDIKKKLNLALYDLKEAISNLDNAPDNTCCTLENLVYEIKEIREELMDILDEEEE